LNYGGVVVGGGDEDVVLLLPVAVHPGQGSFFLSRARGPGSSSQIFPNFYIPFLILMTRVDYKLNV
jgi:hypothetical protein